MDTKNLVNYNRATIQEFYDNGMITSDQYEAYDFAWSNSQFRYSNNFPYRWSNLVQSARAEFWKIYHVLPANIQKRLYQAVCTNRPYYFK